MSLVITVFVPEGIVIAGDSRLSVTYPTKDESTQKEFLHTITASDSNDKVFLVKDKFGLGTFGAADIKGMPVAGFINRFVEEKVSDTTEVDQIPQLLLDFFGQQYNFPNVSFYVVGYKIESGVSVQHVYFLNIATKTTNRINTAGNPFGANWGGEIEVMSRLLSPVKFKQGDQWNELEAAPILFNFFTLQDAIDFAIYAVRTTIESFRFQRRPKTVGGAIDILVLKPGEKPFWVAKKEYKAD
jgi:hypothetical protein